MWQWRKRFLLCVPRSIFGKGVAVAIAPKPCGFSNALEKGIALWKATNFHRSGRRSQAGKWRMGEIRPVSAGKRKGPLLSSALVLSRISAPISTLAAFQRMVLADANAFGETLPASYQSRAPPGCGDLPYHHLRFLKCRYDVQVADSGIMKLCRRFQRVTCQGGLTLR